MPAEEGDTDNVYKQAVHNLDSYFAPKGNVPYERHVFRSLKQDSSETVDQYVSRLKKQALNCDFGDEAVRSEMIRDQVIDACRSNHLRKKLLQKGDELILDTVLQTARAMEAVELQSKHMEVMELEAKSAEVNKLSAKPKLLGQIHENKKHENKKYHNADGASCGKSCYRCGQRGFPKIQTVQPIMLSAGNVVILDIGQLLAKLNHTLVKSKTK